MGSTGSGAYDLGMTANDKKDSPGPDPDSVDLDEPYTDRPASDTQVSDTETKHATNYSPSSERETANRQEHPESSEATKRGDIDDDHVKLLPGTGGPDDEGDMDVDGDDFNLPTG